MAVMIKNPPENGQNHLPRATPSSTSARDDVWHRIAITRSTGPTSHSRGVVFAGVGPAIAIESVALHQHAVGRTEAEGALAASERVAPHDNVGGLQRNCLVLAVTILEDIAFDQRGCGPRVFSAPADLDDLYGSRSSIMGVGVALCSCNPLTSLKVPSALLYL